MGQQIDSRHSYHNSEQKGETLLRTIAQKPVARSKSKGSTWPVYITLLLIGIAWVYGYLSSGTDVAPLVQEVIPGAAKVELRGRLFIGLAEDGKQVAGYAALGESSGYGGPIEMLVGINPQGEITGVKIVKQRETPGFFRLLEREGFVLQFLQKKFDQRFIVGEDLDAISGATFSAEGVAASARQAIRALAQDGMNRSLPAEKRPIKFGIPEATLILLYAAGYFGHKLRHPAWKRRMRWGTMLVGMVMLGFIYTMPFTIAQVVSLMSGFWPDWHNNLYWYLLVGGILFVTTVDAKNPYCAWFCPFGAFQECLATLSGARHYRPRRWSTALTWLQRGMALIAILLGLALRRPGVSGYEPFPTLFDLRGTAVQWIFLLVIVLASLIIYRPFCSYLCPLDPVIDFIAEGRRRIREVWQQWQKHAAKG